MTETDATRRPLQMPEKYIPYFDKFRVYKLFKDMVENLILTLPRDHLKQMKIFLSYHANHTNDVDRVILLVSPELKIDIKKLVKLVIRDLGYFVITRRTIIDNYEDHDDYKPGCVDPVLMSLVTKNLTLREAVITSGWLMFDHPCTLREARCLQADGVLPTVTVSISPTPVKAPPADDPITKERNFFQQDFVGLQYAYKATLKHVYMDSEDTVEKLSIKVFNGIKASAGGQQGTGQGFSVLGAPTTYRVLLLGPPGSGKRLHGNMLAKHFGLVFLDFEALSLQAEQGNDEIGKKIRDFGYSIHTKSEIVKRRLLQQDCLERGWVLVNYPANGNDLNLLDKMSTPPNRIIFLNTEWATCKERLLKKGRDWCTGRSAPLGSGPRVRPATQISEEELDNELDNFFTETLAELRAEAGITAVEIAATELSIEDVQVKLQAAVIAAPAYDIVYAASQLANVRID